MKKIDETGNIYDRLTVLAEAPKRGKETRAFWLCKCICGNEVAVLGRNLRRKITRSCGCLRKEQLSIRTKKDETGRQYGRLTVIREAGLNRRGRIVWLCLCECGEEMETVGSYLRSGDTKSCGCLNIDSVVGRNTKHGLANHPLYTCWYDIMRRCYNLDSKSYEHYGGRGIKVFENWHKPTDFIDWIEKNLGPRPEKMSIDRIDNDGNYEPGNLRWADSSTQLHNRRKEFLKGGAKAGVKNWKVRT